MTDKQIIIDGECLRCGAKTKKHILVCEKCTEEMGTVIAHKFTIDKQTREIKQLKKQLLRKEQEVQEAMDNYVKLDNQRVKEYNELVDKYKAKEQECEKAKQNAQDTYDLWQALIESFNILQGEKIKLEQECEELKAKFELFKSSNQTTIDQLKADKEELTTKLQKYIDREQRDIELAKKRADSFREIQKMLYGKFYGSSLIEKRNPYEN